MKQLPLDLQIQRPVCSFDNYIAGQNQAVLQQIHDIINRQPPHLFYLWGETGTGKSHLLQAANHFVLQQKNNAIYLPLRQLIHYSCDILENLGDIDLLCIDDIQMIAGKADWEYALFGLCNQLLDEKIPLLVAGNQAVIALQFSLQDLVSRLVWGGVFQLTPLGNDEKQELIQQYTQYLGLSVSPQVMKYLLNHCDNGDNMRLLIQCLHQLDDATRIEKRRLTIPFLKSQLDHD